MLDASQEPHWCIPTQIFIKLHCVQVLHSDPSENSPEKEGMWSISSKVMGFISCQFIDIGMCNT
jgi:hypothetical protein